jgi:DNA-directed RNA polymerase specialized sigma24 family protein
MSWNNGYETKKFKKEQERIAKQYRNHGASEELINEMLKFLLAQFREERTYREHTESFEITEYLSKDNTEFHSRYWWIEAISDPNLVKKIKSLSKDDIELLTLYAISGYTQDEIAQMKGCTKQNIQKKIRRIKNFLK